MASSNSQKELLTLIRDVSTEKSQGERRVVNLKRQIEELQSELDSMNVELEDAKRLKECTEQDLKGFEVELAMNESSIQTLEGRISLLQGEVSTIGSELEALKISYRNEVDLLCPFSIWNTMRILVQLYEKTSLVSLVPSFPLLLKFQQSVASASYETCSSKAGSQNELSENTAILCIMPFISLICSIFILIKVHAENAKTREVEEQKKHLEDELAQIISDTKKMEHEFLLEQNFHNQEQKEVDDLKHRISLMEAVMEGSKELQELAIYPHSISTQTTRVEDTYTSLCDKLQKKCICPSCDCDNMEMLGGVLQKSS
ncbi:hypothetical protein SSX86_014582 [Deinandra increscens subsp. villosa]|uniref:Tropomyosin n=1 Tax=Deinandra increscens subsp. villosa TaxID=3103831 RepID=A0AAP0D267_9ASTR